MVGHGNSAQALLLVGSFANTILIFANIAFNTLSGVGSNTVGNRVKKS